MEPLANITEYACDDEGEEWPSINCVMKRLYSDFIVTEIPADGQVLKPKQAEKPKIESKVPDDIADDDHVVEVPSEFEARSDEMRRLEKVAAGEIDLCTFDLKVNILPYFSILIWHATRNSRKMSGRSSTNSLRLIMERLSLPVVRMAC